MHHYQINTYKGIDSLATLSDSLSFNINSDSFNFKWKLLEALPISETRRISLVIILMAVASFSLYFHGFPVRIDFSKCSYWRRFVLPTYKHHCRCCT